MFPSAFLKFYIQWKLDNAILPNFQICKSFDKEREKTFMQQSMRKENLRKVGLCFIADLLTLYFFV